jgi:hypothetical protein
MNGTGQAETVTLEERKAMAIQEELLPIERGF